MLPPEFDQIIAHTKAVRAIRLSATIFLTDACNLACTYCYECNKEFKRTSKETIAKFIDLLYNTPRFSEIECISLDFIGGEPLLEPELIAFSISYFIREGLKRKHHWVADGLKNVVFFCTTNGTLFSEPKVQALLKQFPLICGLSLDGTKEAHDTCRKYRDGRGSYDSIMENFDWWKKTFKQGSAKGTFSHATLPFVGDSLIHQMDLGLQPWTNATFDEVWTPEDAVEYGKQVDKFLTALNAREDSILFSTRSVSVKELDCPREDADNWCGTGRYMVAMGIDGTIYPCHRFATNTHKYPIGHVDTGLDEEALNSLISNFSKLRCVDCNQAGACPACAAAFYDIAGGDFKPCKNICELVKVQFKTEKKFYSQELKKANDSIKWGYKEEENNG